MAACSHRQMRWDGIIPSRQEWSPVATNWVHKFSGIILSDGEYIRVEEGLQREGYGVHTTSEGLSYYGHWNGDKMNGQGETLTIQWIFRHEENKWVFKISNSLHL